MIDHERRSVYSVSGDGYLRARVWKRLSWGLRVEDQKWSPLHVEKAATWFLSFGRWGIAVQRRTKHFADNNWKAE